MFLNQLRATENPGRIGEKIWEIKDVFFCFSTLPYIITIGRVHKRGTLLILPPPTEAQWGGGYYLLTPLLSVRHLLQ